MTKDEALKLSLDVLVEINKLSIGENAISLPAEIDTAINAAEEVLAQPEQPKVRTGDCLLVGVCASEGHKIQKTQPEQKPMAWERHAKKLTDWLYCMSYNDSYFGEPAGLVKQVTSELNRLIVNAPPQRPWVGLTDDEREELMDTYDVASTDYARAIEAKLKEKNR